MYDRATKTNFKMHVWYQYSMHDLSAYGLLYAWCVHGKFPCPVYVIPKFVNHVIR
jgi:hypothetical protein